MRTVTRMCPLCEATCGLRLTLDEDDRVTRVRGDPDDPAVGGVNSNLLTDEQDVDPLSGNAVLNGIPVDVAVVA